MPIDLQQAGGHKIEGLASIHQNLLSTALLALALRWVM
jgi:hypothetical protein